MKPPVIQHVLYEYDGPKLVLAVDERDRQVIGVFADEPSERAERWVYAPVTPTQVIALLEGAALRDVFTNGLVSIFDITPSDVSSEELLGASLPDDLLPSVDATLPELTTSARERILEGQRRWKNQEQGLARAELLFDGRPVFGQQGINAAFGAAALAKYQELVSMVYGSRRKGSLSPTGPIPHRDESTLYIVDMPRGSVGFTLHEISEQGQFTPTGLAEVVSDVGALIDAAAAGDQELAEVVSDFEPRVVSTLRELFSVVHKADATFRLMANDKAYRFDAERVKMAAERTATEPSEQPDIPFFGTLSGYMPDARQFELRLEEPKGPVLRGRIARDADLGQIRAWFDKLGEAHLRVVTMKRGGREVKAFTLLRIEPKSVGA